MNTEKAGGGQRNCWEDTGPPGSQVGVDKQTTSPTQAEWAHFMVLLIGVDFY